MSGRPRGTGPGFVAEQIADQVLLLLNLPLEIGDRLRRRINQFLRLAQIEQGGGAIIK